MVSAIRNIAEVSAENLKKGLHSEGVASEAVRELPEDLKPQFLEGCVGERRCSEQ
jgi:hypothetical protein